MVVAIALSYIPLVTGQRTGRAGGDARGSVSSSPGYLHAEGNKLFDSGGRQVRIAGANWYGFETSSYVVGGLWAADYRRVLDLIDSLGYNTLRLPFSNEMVETNPVPSGIAFANAGGPINGDLSGLTSLDVLDKVIAYAGQLGLMVVLDNHRSEAGNGAQGNGLWYTPTYSESAWIDDWRTLALRYQGNPVVVGFDLRNEPHTPDGSTYGVGATWGDGSANDWRLAAQRAGEAILSINPDVLIVVEGIGTYPNGSGGFDSYWWGGNLLGAHQFPVQLSAPDKLVYSAHDYGPNLFSQPWFNGSTTYETLTATWRKYWAFVDEENLAPIVVGEFGTTNDAADISATVPGSQGQWFAGLAQYLGASSSLNWTYWAINGEDRYGLLGSDYVAVASHLKQNKLLGMHLPHRLYLPLALRK